LTPFGRRNFPRQDCFDEAINRDSLSSDMRTLIASAEPRAQDAVDIFCDHQITTISTSMNCIDEQYSPAEQPQGSTKKLRKSGVTEPRTRPRFNDT
jgi:hypothetical protein